jgi:4-amino-4-deoxy-L-arabinose transferase-like glycosyltransferase
MLPRYRIAEVLIVGASAAVAAAWIAVDRVPPQWDQSHYLLDAFRYVQVLHHDGPGSLISAFFTIERFYGPGYPAFLFPFLLVFGPSAQSALIANLCLWVVLLFTVGAIARQIFGNTAGLIAVAATATVPFLSVLLHNVLVDIAALTWSCLAVLAMLRSGHFSRPIPAALAGVFAGVGLLTKATVLVFLAGPVLVIGLRALLRLRDAPTRQRLRVVACMVLALVVGLAVAAPWYVTNWDITLTYLQSATSGPLSVGAGPANPLDPGAILGLVAALLNDASWALGLGAVALAVVLLWNRLRAARGLQVVKSTRRKPRWWSWALLLSWAAVPVAVLATSHNQDPRYAVVVFPVLAIVLAGLYSGVMRPPAVRVAVVAIVIAVGVAQIGLAEFPPGSAIPDGAVASVGGAALFAPAYQPANPNGDDGTPVMRQLEAMTGGRPAHVLLAQDDHVFNINTLKWLAAIRNDDMTFDLPSGLTGDPSELSGYDIALVMPSSAVVQRNPGLRLQILNATTPSAVYGNQLFAIFGRSKHDVRLDGGFDIWVLQR